MLVICKYGARTEGELVLLALSLSHHVESLEDGNYCFILFFVKGRRYGDVQIEIINTRVLKYSEAMIYNNQTCLE